jgi:hypothetical protein
VQAPGLLEMSSADLLPSPTPLETSRHSGPSSELTTWKSSSDEHALSLNTETAIVHDAPIATLQSQAEHAQSPPRP